MRLIDADALESALADRVRRSNNSDFVAPPTWNSAVDIVVNAPSIDAVLVKHGKWIVINGCVCCSVCGEPNMEWNFCPNCGAKMDGGKDDERA